MADKPQPAKPATKLGIVPEYFLELLASPISFHTSLARLCGSVTAGLMLSQAIYWSRTDVVKKRDGWFYKSAREWTEETCLSRAEQETARKSLTKLKYVQIDKKPQPNGMGLVLFYRVNFQEIFASYSRPENQHIDLQETGSRLPETDISTAEKQHIDLQPHIDTQNKCNKEEDIVLPALITTGGKPPSQSVLLIAQSQFGKAIPPSWREAERFAPQSVNVRDYVYSQVRVGAKMAGLDYPLAKRFLADHPLWKDWPDLPLLDAQQEITFPETVAPKSTKQQLPELDETTGERIWEFIRDSLKTSPHSRDTWIKPIRILGVHGSTLYLQIPTKEFKHVGEKFPALKALGQERGIAEFCFVDAESYEL